MNIAQMHIWFRQYAQQMGMQNVRAILPEQIDLMINTSISDIVNELIQTNVGLTNDRVVTNNSKIGQINALRTLYRVKEATPTKGSIYKSGADDSEVTTDENDSGYVDCSFAIADLMGGAKELSDDGALFIVDAAVRYNKPYGHGISKWFPIAIIEDAYLADALQDFSMRPTFRQPIANIYTADDTSKTMKFDVWFGEKDVDNIHMTNYPTINKIRISYVAKPQKVKYVSDLGETNVNCDLPESMHVDILKHAVDLYRTSVTGNLYAAQEADRNQQREIARNNARPTNEGYQS